MIMEKYYAGALSGIIEVICTHPIDYLKIKRQENIQKNIYTTNITKILNEHKFSTFYSGVIPRLCGVIPMRFIFWGVQGNANNYIDTHYPGNKYKSFFVGTTGASVQSIIDNQIELVKISKMTKLPLPLQELIQFRGFASTLYRNVIFTNFVAYSCFQIEHKNKLEKFMYSATSGLIGSIVSQPFDYVKTIKHRQDETIINGINIRNMSTISILGHVIRDNPRNLFSGGISRGILGFSTMGIGFLTYDTLTELLK